MGRLLDKLRGANQKSTSRHPTKGGQYRGSQAGIHKEQLPQSLKGFLKTDKRRNLVAIEQDQTQSAEYLPSRGEQKS